MAARRWKPDEIPEEMLAAEARQMADEFQLLHEKVARRRLHFYTDKKVDPMIGGNEGNRPDADDPFRHIRGFQTDNLRKKAGEFVLRVTENEPQYSVEPPDETQSLERIANDISQVMQSWDEDDEQRSGSALAWQLAWAAVRDGYAVFHDLRCEHYWPEIEWDEADDDRGELSEEQREVECPGCGGEGDDCPQCGGTGTVMKDMLTLRGSSKAYVETVTREYADAGSPWMRGTDDVLGIKWREDRDPRGGFARLLVTYETRASDYEKDVGPEAYRAAWPLPGISQGSNTVGIDTPNYGHASDNVRVQVNQLWTRSHLYEWVEGAGVGKRLVKSGKHGYRRIPYYLFAPLDTGHADLVWRFRSPLDGLYSVKEWADWVITIMSGIVENQKDPVMIDVLNDPSLSPLTADGSPSDDREGTVAARNGAPGTQPMVITQPMPQSIPQFTELVMQRMVEAAPDTGKVEAGANAPAWTMRLGQEQASREPRQFVDAMAKSMQLAGQFRLYWHEDNGQRLIGYGGSKRNRPVVVMPEDLRNQKFQVFINPVSGAERVAIVEHNRELLTNQLILPRDFYEAMGEKDPDDAAMRVKAYYLAEPYRDARARARMAEKLGSAFLLGPGPEMLDSQGNGIAPEQVLQGKGYQPSGGVPPNMNQVTMPDLQPLERNMPGEPEMTRGLPG